MYLVTRCFNEFRAPDRQRGHAYYEDKRVSLDTVRGRWILATVRGSQDYEVTIDGSEAEARGRLAVVCQCARFTEGVPCKHLWATILAIGRAHPKLFPGNHPLELVLEILDSDYSETDETEWPEILHDLAAEPPIVAKAATAVGSSWKQRFESLRGALGTTVSETGVLTAPLAKRPQRQAWYRLDIEASTRWDRLTIELWQRKQKKDGSMGKLKTLRIDDAVVQRFSDPEDRALLRFFRITEADQDLRLGTSRQSARRPVAPQKQTSAVIPGVLLDTLLPRLVATGRFGLWSTYDSRPPRLLQWEADEPWHLVIRSKIVEAGELQLGARLERHKDQSREPKEARLLLPNEGLVLFGESLAPFELSETAWLEHLGGELHVPAAEIPRFLTDLWSLPERPPVVLPADLKPKEVHTAPTPHLKLRPPRRPTTVKILLAEISFGYADQSVRAHDPRPVLFEPKGRRLLVRDLDAERQAFKQLAEAGLEPPPVWVAESSEYSVRPADLTACARKLTAKGWIVEAEGRRLRGASQFEMRLKSEIDWFELTGEATFGNIRVALPELLKALRRGSATIVLDDGTEGLLPEDWLTRYTPLAELAQVGTGDGVRFLPSQTLLLDTLLAAAPNVEIDPEFTQLRERLRSFTGIEPRREPRGFRGELRPYQREGLGWLHFLEMLSLGGCLADDMGLGKTVQVLALLQMRRAASRGWDKPSLIVAPKSVVQNWLDEAQRFAPRLATGDYTGAERHDILERLAEHDVVVTTYGTLLRDVAKLKDCKLGYLILDEAQAIKNPSSQTSKACRLLQADHRLALTGTPIENHIGELWSIFEFLNPGMLGRLPALAGTAGRTPSKEALEQVSRALGPFILRRTKKEVLKDLPAKTEQTLYCDLEAKQRLLYDELREHYRVALGQRIGEQGLGRSKIQVLEALLRLRQAACHPGLISEEHAELPAGKIEVLFEQLDEILDEGHKALIFSQFTQLLGLVRQKLDEREITYEYLDGRTRKRQPRIERFQNDPDCPLFLISLKAGGVGLNLTAADYVFLLDPWWNPAVEAQAIDRAHRMGQVRPVNAYRLIARDTVEEKIMELQASKRELADAILTADRSLISGLTSADLELLLS